MLAPLPLTQVGQAIGGKYVVERTLGEGGMGVVLEVRHAQLQQRFAVKLLRPEILYELLSGEVPFKGETPGQVAVSVAVDKVVPPRSYRPDLPAEIEQVVTRALAKDPDDRFPTIRAFAAALVPFAPGFNTSHWSRPPPPPAAPVEPLDRTGSKPSLETATTLHVHTGPQPRSSRAVWIGGGSLLFLALAGALLIGRSRTPEPASAPKGDDRPVAPPVTAASTAEVRPTSSAPLPAEPSAVPTMAASSSPAVERPVKPGAKPMATASEKPALAKTAAPGGPLPTRL